jgi:hypothetical protein
VVVPRTSACGSCHAAKASSGIPRRARDLAWSAITVLTARPGVCSMPPRRRVCFFFIVKTSRGTKSRTFRGRKITLPKGSCDLWSHLPPRCRAARNRAKRSSWTTCVSPPCVSTAGFRKRTGDFVSRAGPKIAGNTVPTVVVFFVREERINTTYP